MNSQIFTKIPALFSQEMSNCGYANYCGKLQIQTEPWDQMAQHQKRSQAAWLPGFRGEPWCLASELSGIAPNSTKLQSLISFFHAANLMTWGLLCLTPDVSFVLKRKLVLTALNEPLQAVTMHRCNIQPQAAKVSKINLKVINTV